MTQTRIIYLLYRLVQMLGSPLVLVYFFLRCVKDWRYFDRFTERLGYLPHRIDPAGAPALWMHAVSVGEVISSAALIRRIQHARPSMRIYVSVTTVTGRAMAEDRLHGLVDGIFFAPIDYVWVIRRKLRVVRPSVVVILETEIWPNLFREAKRAGAALLVVNARISDRALPRYQRWAWFFRHVLQHVDRVLAQSDQDRERYLSLGAPSAKDVGNLKYDFTPPGPIAADLREYLDRLWPESVWIAASTMAPADAEDPDEDDAVIEAFLELATRHSRLLLILVPRKPERFASAAAKLAQSGISFTRRTELRPVTLPGVLLIDTMGELAPLFQAASAVFMGGTLASRGGHNILEPAFFAKPVIAGPHMENFAAIAQEFTDAGALIRIGGPGELAEAVHRAITDPGETGNRAHVLAESKRGVADRIAAEILDAAVEALPAPKRTLVARAFLTPLAGLWFAGHQLNLRRQFASRRTLKTKVISVGGLAMGGAGKSPFVSYLAGHAAARGLTPAILTRGYRRKTADSAIIVPKGQKASIDLTGDEAQTFIREGIAHVGIGADRYATGFRMETELVPDLFLLDDGFQHVRLARDHDIVLIDALNPLAGGLFPLGRRREPLEGLKRATAVVITRTEPGVSTAAIEKVIRRYNAEAPIFRSRVVPREWVDLEWGTPRKVSEAPLHKVAAFCGLGSPSSFWRTLDELGLDVVFRWDFGDHHHYVRDELARFLEQARDAGAEAIVTTEKDVMNLCPEPVQVVHPLRIFYLRIVVEVDNEEALLRMLL